jgi:hypothetical protein
MTFVFHRKGAHFRRPSCPVHTTQIPISAAGEVAKRELGGRLS